MAKKDTTTGAIPDRGAIVLKNAIPVAGKKVKEFDYDMNEVTPKLYSEALAHSSASSRTDEGVKVDLVEFSTSDHLYLGWACVIAADESTEITFDQLDHIKGLDINKIMRVGRTFALGSAVESADENSSDTGSSSAEPLTQA